MSYDDYDYDDDDDEEVEKKLELQKVAIAIHCDEAEQVGTIFYVKGKTIEAHVDEYVISAVAERLFNAEFHESAPASALKKKVVGIWIWDGYIYGDDLEDDYQTFSWRPANTAEWLAMMDDRSPFEDDEPTPPRETRGFGTRHTL